MRDTVKDDVTDIIFVISTTHNTMHFQKFLNQMFFT